MPTPTHRLRLVLIQVRDHRRSLEQEQRCLVNRCGVQEEQFRFFNVARQPSIRWQDVADAHAVFIGGAGGYSATRAHPFSRPLAEVVMRLIDEHRPLFGCCWGHQFIAWVRGGLVVEDMVSAEIGTRDIRLTDAGRRDPLFGDLPERFAVQVGHHDRVLEPGPEAVELAVSALCPYQAIRFGSGPVYGTQFHSELDEDALRERLEVYRANYVTDEDHAREILASLRPSPASDRLLARFLQLFA